MDEDFAIQTSELTKYYGEHAAVAGLDLSVASGCAFGLLGPNGAGKSTTIQMLLGLTSPTSGRATVLGKDVAREARSIRAEAGYVPERHYIYAWMTVGEVIRFTRALYATWNDALCDRLLNRYDLDTGKKVKHLSHGMVTKLALLLALAHEPRILILDEPTSGLDPLIREEFNESILERMKEDGRTVLFSSHILSDVDKVADTIGILSQGRLLITSPRAELVRLTKRIEVTLTETHGSPVPPAGTVWQCLRGNNWSLTVHGFSDSTMEELHAKNTAVQSRVLDMGLEEIFKDFVRGNEQP